MKPDFLNLLETGRSGLVHLGKGEYEPIRRYLYDTVVSPLRRYPLFDAVYEERRRGVYARAVESATRTEGATVELRDMSQDAKRYGRFTTAESLQFDPPFRFNSIEFDVGNVSEQAGVRVHVTFDLGDDTTAEETVSFHNGSFHDRETVSFAVDVPKTAEAASLSLHTEDSTSGIDVEADGWTKLNGDRPLLGEPRAASVDGSAGPIFLISIDTFRYDYLDALDPLLDELGSDAVVPEEPRTQGISTWPSHASIFTGAHPSVHGLYSGNFGPKIDESLPTLAAFLREQGYVTSGIVSSSNLASEFGYGRGFDRYRVEDISWESRRFDASTVIKSVREWVRTDTCADRENGFYFLHLFDAHYPYIPTQPRAGAKIDYDALDSIIGLVSNRKYLQLLRDDPLNPDPSVLDLIKTYYRQSLEYVADELATFVHELKRHDVFEESLIIVTGDHGEDFYERNFMFHNSLYDTNIRPGMIVKPPADASFDVPDRVDTIDFFPPSQTS